MSGTVHVSHLIQDDEYAIKQELSLNLEIVCYSCFPAYMFLFSLIDLTQNYFNSTPPLTPLIHVQ